MKVRIALAVLLSLGIYIVPKYIHAPALWQDLAVPVLHVLHMPVVYVQSWLARPSFEQWQELTDKYAQATYQLKQNEQLLLAYKNVAEYVAPTDFSYALSKVMGWNTANTSHNLFIGGTFAKDQPVVTPKGLVGRVVEAGMYHSRVMLITDKLSRIPVRLADYPIQAILCGRGDAGMTLEFDKGAPEHLPNGSMLVTSGVGGIFPPDIPIARVYTQQGTPLSYEATAVVEITDLRFVQVLQAEINTLHKDRNER